MSVKFVIIVNEVPLNCYLLALDLSAQYNENEAQIQYPRIFVLCFKNCTIFI